MDECSLDTSLGLLANRHRRRLLEHLLHTGSNVVEFDDLLDQLHKAEPVVAADHQPSRPQLAIRLHHTDLPKLEAHGILEYDYDRGTIAYHGEEQIGTVLERLPEGVSISRP